MPNYINQNLYYWEDFIEFGIFFSKITLKKVIDYGVELCILQSRSPNCGEKKIYDGTFLGHKIPGQGVFAKMLIDAGIKVVDVEDL